MQINWFTVIAQILNFLILVWLLKRYLYIPVLKTIADREKKIFNQLEEAASKERFAKLEQEKFLLKNKEFEQEKKNLMALAVAEVKEERDKLLEEARNEFNALRAKQGIAITEMQEQLQQELAKKTQEEVLLLTSKTISELASSSLEDQSVTVFLKHLRNITDIEKKQFMEIFQSNTNPILLQSAFDLSDSSKDEIQKYLIEILGKNIILQFKNSPKIICGIELIGNGYKLGWSVSEYIASLQKYIHAGNSVKPDIRNEIVIH